jgi:hypothetical protein
MTYQQHLALALVALGEDDFVGALAGLQSALDEASRLDPEGPRVAEVCSYLAQVQLKAGDTEAARATQARVDAIWARFPGP